MVGGSSGAGKSTVARELARRLDLPYVELDALFHGPGWTERETFAADVDAATRADAWVVDGNYTTVRDLVWDRAEVLVWLDLSRWLTEWQVVRRSATRAAARAQLWNGNREDARHWYRASHPIRWSWAHHAGYRADYAARVADPRWAHLDVYRLRSRSDVRRFLGGMT